MAHDPDLHACSPANIYGPFEQTQFLGLSVLSFSASAGINEQSSEVTIELVQDLCVSKKRYVKTESAPFEVLYHTEADPGFTYPVVGAPCYFRVAEFEYSGILQSWTKKVGSDGFPVFTVKLVDPRILLDNVQVILSDYQGAIKGLNPNPMLPVVFPDYQLVNIVNAYGFLDSIRQNCGFVDANGNPASDGYVAYDGGEPVYFGAPAGGWGTSTGNDAGIPWNYLKKAIQCLLGRQDAPNAPYFSKGAIYGPPGNPKTTVAGGYGEIFTGGTIGPLAVPAKYIIDISEIPDAPLYYRVSGPIITVSEMISQVCRDAGCDYYVELLPTGNALVIKVRVIVRREQPTLGGIESFITAFASEAGKTSATIGKEYRPNPNNAFIIGDKKRSVYRHSGTGNYGDQSIQPYWGVDINGKLIPSYQSTCENDPTDPWTGPADWNVRLDFRFVMGLLQHKPTTQLSPDGITPLWAWTKLDTNNQAWVWEGELRAALGTFKDFINFLLQSDPYCTPAFDRKAITGDSTLLRLWAQDLELGFQGAQIRPPVYGVGIGVGAVNFIVPPDKQTFLSAINVQVSTTGPAGPGSTYLKDAQRMHQWLQKYAQEHYGRKWLVEVPFACYAGDTGNSDTLQWTDQPSPEGGWTDSWEIIELVNSTKHGIAIERFKTEDGRLEPILRWTQNAPDASPICTTSPCITGLDYDQVPMSDMVTNLFDSQVAQGPDLYVWQRAELADHWVTGSPYTGSNQNRAFALLTCQPITTGFPVNDGKRSPDSFVVRSGLRDIDVRYKKEPMIGLAGSFGSRMISPLAAAVPILSNTQTYGPWWKEAQQGNAIEPYGTVVAEQDTTLNPWEYGGTEYMNVGAITKLENATTKMNIAERGEVTVPGYPTKSLGAQITSTADIYGNGRAIGEGGFFGYKYHFVTLGESTAGASIENLNVVVSPQGVTTSYTISTFTPVFGRFSKGNADRIKKIGRNKLTSDRARKKLSAKSVLKGMDPASRAYTVLSSLTAGPAYSPNSAGILLAGRLMAGEPQRKVVIIADKNTFAFYEDYTDTAMMSIDGLLRPVAHTGARIPGIYRATGGGLPAMKAYTDIFCPIGTGIIDYELTGVMGSMTGSGSGTLGSYSGFPIGTRYNNLYAPASPPPPMPQSSGIIVAANYLDPLADYGSNRALVTGLRATGALGTGTGADGGLLYTYASGHDIESVARGDPSGLERISNSGWSGQNMMIAGEWDRYTVGTTDGFGFPSESGSGDYRFMALKGPLVLHSWGYDTYGKPIPNSKGHSGDPSFPRVSGFADIGNTHQREQDGLTDRFAPNWLADATNWPVAPVDLRYDRIRGLWTSPPPFRLMKVMSITDVVMGETGLAEVLTGGDMFNEDGLAFSGIVTLQPTGTGGPDDRAFVTGIPPLISFRPDFDVASGSVLISYYDTYSCEHWVLGQGSSGGGAGGVDGNINAIGDFVCEGDIITSSSTRMTFSRGVLVSTG